MKTLLILTFTFLSLSACTPPRATKASGSVGDTNVGIIGGTLVAPKDTIAKATALLLMYNSQTNDAFICSSVLVTNDILLSAAHCFFDEATGRMRGANFTKFIIFKTTFDIQASDSFESAYVIPETAYMTHPKYSNSSLANDIAVLRLPKALLPGLVPVKILSSLSGVKDVTVAGFGLSSIATTAPRVSVLRRLKTTLSTRRDPAAPLAVAIRASSNSRPFTGDSGGPAFATVNGATMVWGLDSHALEANDREYYTPIAPYADFIQQSARKLGSKTF